MISTPIWPTNFFFRGLGSTRCEILSQAAILCNIKEKLMMQLEKMAKTLIPDPIWSPENFSWVLPLLVVRQCSKLSSSAISRKTNESNLRKWQKNLLILVCFSTSLVPKNTSCGFHLQ